MAAYSYAEAPTWFIALVSFGVVLMPASMILTMTRLRERLRFITLVGYIWMGVFTIAFFFAFVQLAFILFSVPVHSVWMLYAIAAISLWSLRINFTGPQVVIQKMQGPEFLRGFRMLQISDLHVGMPLLREKWLQTVVDRIQGAKPDLVLVTGDLADAPYEEAAHFLEPLAQVTAPKYYVTGNHEYIRGGDWEQKLRELGFSTLHNTHDIISRYNGKLLIAGVPDRHVNRFHRRLESDPDRALQSETPVDYKILLAHEPASVFDIKKENCDLLLSGHTHGGQIFPFGIFVRMANPIVSGFKMINNIRVFAHQGTGYWGPPMRWFTRCEIVVFEYK